MPSAEGVDVDLDRVLEEAVEQQRVLGARLDVLAQVGAQIIGRVADLHRPAAEHVGGPDEQREADARPAISLRLVGAEGGAVRRVGDPEPLQHRPEPAAILGEVDRVDRACRAASRPASSSVFASRSGVWPPNWTITPSGCSCSITARTSSAVSGSK